MYIKVIYIKKYAFDSKNAKDILILVNKSTNAW
jgi:hypothetical protein